MSDENRRFTKDERSAIRRHAYDIASAHAHAATDFGRQVLDAPENIVSQGAMRLLDDLDAADEEIAGLWVLVGEAGDTAFQFAKEYARLHEALEQIVNIESTANEHALLTTVRMAKIARTALSGIDNEGDSHGR